MHRVAFHAERDRLDQRRSTAFARLFDRPSRLAVDGEDVGTVDPHAFEPVGRGAVREMLDAVLEMRRGRVCPLVVVDHEDDRQPTNPGEVHPLVRVAAGGRPLAAPGNRHPLLFADPEGETHAHRDREHRRQVADHRVQPEVRVAEVDVAVAPVRRPVRAAHELSEDAPWLHAAGDVDAHVALQRAADVVCGHRRCDPHSGGLVATSGVERAWDLPLLVEDVAALFDSARGQHVAVHAEQVLVVEACVLHLLERTDRLGFA